MSATPAYISVLPVPPEMRIDLAVVAGNLAKTKNHSCKANETYTNEKCYWPLYNSKRVRIAHNREQACRPPETSK